MTLLTEGTKALYGWDGFYDGFTTEPHRIYTSPAGGELWQGGSPYQLNGRWDVIVGLQHEPTDRLLDRVKFNGIYIWHPIDDMDVKDAHALRSIAAMVADRVEMGDKVLVHCSAGLNRSGVINGRALMWLGMSVDEAVSTIRKNRYSSALCNPRFVRWLYEEERIFAEEEDK